MHAKRSPNDPGPDPSMLPTREVDSVSSLAAELLLREHDDAESGRRPTSAVRPEPSPSPPPSRTSLRDSLHPDEPSRGARVVMIVGGIVLLVALSGGAAFLLTR